jgi:predicted nucleic acid-binding protein
MLKPVASYLLDTNILLRLSKRDSLEFPTIRTALGKLLNQSIRLCYASQNLIEFWNVATRPIDRNGYGLSIKEANDASRRIEKAFMLLPASEKIHYEWRRLVVAHGVPGAKVHDAHLVAAMIVYDVTHILTFNDQDFSRYAAMTAVHPSRVLVS